MSETGSWSLGPLAIGSVHLVVPVFLACRPENMAFFNLYYYASVTLHDHYTWNFSIVKTKYLHYIQNTHIQKNLSQVITNFISIQLIKFREIRLLSTWKMTSAMKIFNNSEKTMEYTLHCRNFYLIWDNKNICNYKYNTINMIRLFK